METICNLIAVALFVVRVLACAFLYALVLVSADLVVLGFLGVAGNMVSALAALIVFAVSFPIMYCVAARHF